MKLLPSFLLLALVVSASAGPRINHEGRILGPVPVVSQPVLFNTPEADAVVSAMQIMPVTSAWNEDVSRRPLLVNSDAMIAQITADLASNRRTLRPFYEMNYVLVPDAQPVRTIHFFNYADESDLNGGVSPNGLYPIPENLPVETWPRETGALTLAQWQQDANNAGGDRHAIMVQPGAGLLWETWQARLVNGAWEASNGAKFDLKTNTLRPAGWTSGDAAGLPMFPALVRYDECQRGMVEHAVRLVVKRSRLGPIYPATHAASVGGLTDPNIPAMGQRLRLKAAFVIPVTWTTAEKAVCLALKKYGGLVADNGGFFSFSVCPDDRFAANAFDHLSTIAISHFEVVQSTGPNGGPRSPGVPTVSAGTNLFVAPGASVALEGAVTSPSGPATVLWKAVVGPGAVTFTNSAQPNATATFTKPGTHLLRLSADDGVHAVAYDAITVEVVLPVQAARSGDDFLVRFPSRIDETYRVERSPDLSPTGWTILADNLSGTGGPLEVADSDALALPQCFYRVKVLP